MPDVQENKTKNVLDEKTQKALNEILASLQFGSVTLIIQNGKVVQIEKSEKRRLV
ncbi:MAG: YezD family protein [Treponema sp.]|jgi:hypothetical protein|nr:YezD family protein [Treponema sp.]